ncbi:MAG: transketolase C-terminal domain-containing protein [Gammaproteobacteria bacterium]|jgi:transketolase
MRDTFIKALTALAEKDSRIMLITSDVGFGVLTNFAERFPNQFLNVGVAEQNMTGVATGMALENRIVFTYSIANFPTLRCLEQIRNDAAYHDVNVKIVSIGGGFSYGALGMSHHATEDIAIMRALPIKVMVPGTLWEVEQATKALIDISGTCYLRLDKSHAGNVDYQDKTFVFGKACRIKDGNDITLIAAGGILADVIEAAEILAQQGIQCRVVSMHTINPIDEDEIISAAKETGGIVTVEEHTVHGGLGGAIAEISLESGVLPRKFYRIGLRDGFSMIVGSQTHLKKVYNMDVTAIVTKVKSILGK